MKRIERIKKAAVVGFLVLYLLLAAGCMLFGRELRDLLSPRVQVVALREVEMDGRWMYELPEGALVTGADGEMYVFLPKECEKYTEPRYMALACPVEPRKIDNRYYISLSDLPAARVILCGEGALRDGDMIVTE